MSDRTRRVTAFRTALGLHWAMTPDALDTMLKVAARWTSKDPAALEKELGRPLAKSERVSVRDGVAIIQVRGSLFRYGNLFTRISGGTSYDVTARDLNAALNSPEVRAILLNVDSPGGEVNGAHELAEMIYAARGKKPIKSYVGGQGCSGGYWLASASDEVICDETAMLGSVGVIWAYLDDSKYLEENGFEEIVIVSKQSPKKNTDPTTDEGYARMQALADQLAGVFVRDVARNRGVSEQKVISDFGEGWVKVGADAVNAGLADRLGSFESVLAELSGRDRQGSGFRASNPVPLKQVSSMTTDTNTPAAAETEPQEPAPATVESLEAAHPELVASIRSTARAEGIAAENERIHAIEKVALPGHQDLLAAAKKDVTITPEAFMQSQIHAEQKSGAAALSAIKSDEEEIDAPPAAPSSDVEASQPSGNGIGAANPAKVQRILNAGKRQKPGSQR